MAANQLATPITGREEPEKYCSKHCYRNLISLIAAWASCPQREIPSVKLAVAGLIPLPGSTDVLQMYCPWCKLVLVNLAKDLSPLAWHFTLAASVCQFIKDQPVLRGVVDLPLLNPNSTPPGDETDGGALSEQLTVNVRPEAAFGVTEGSAQASLNVYKHNSKIR